MPASVPAFTLAFAGMAALAFAMDRHHEQLTGAQEAPPVRRRMLRCAGVLLLVMSMLSCIQFWGATVGLVAWLGWLSAGALGVAAGIAVTPRWTAGAAWLAVLGALIALGGIE